MKYIFLIFLILPCKQIDSKNMNNASNTATVYLIKKQNTDNINPRQVAIDFTERIKTGKDVASLLASTWMFIYHQDDRCSGATDGKVTYGKNSFIDTTMKIKVKNNSEYAWACEKKESYYFEMSFNLKEELKNWDRFELQPESYSDTSEKEKNTFYILGEGASDYIKLYVNEDNLISTFKYSSEDPG